MAVGAAAPAEPFGMKGDLPESCDSAPLAAPDAIAAADNQRKNEARGLMARVQTMRRPASCVK